MNPCEGCAYTEGAEANLEPQNSIKSQLCLLGAIPFYCHHSRDGALQDLRDVRAADLREGLRSGRIQICQGWRREVKSLAATGYYQSAAELKRAYARLGLGALKIFVETEDGVKKRGAAKTLKQIILSLNRERGFTEVGDEA